MALPEWGRSQKVDIPALAWTTLWWSCRDPRERSAMLPFTSWKSGRFLRATHNRRLKKSRFTSTAKGDMVIRSAAPSLHRLFARQLSVPHDGQIADAGRDSAFCELERSVSAVLILESAVNPLGVSERCQCRQSHGRGWDSMAELATDPKKASRSIKSREVDAGSEGAARNTLATALIVLSVAVGLLLVWQTSSSLLVIFAGILFASFLDACARALGSVMPVGSCLAINPGRDHPDNAHRVGNCLGSRKNSGPSTGLDTRHGYAA